MDKTKPSTHLYQANRTVTAKKSSNRPYDLGAAKRTTTSDNALIIELLT